MSSKQMGIEPDRVSVSILINKRIVSHLIRKFYGDLQFRIDDLCK